MVRFAISTFFLLSLSVLTCVRGTAHGMAAIAKRFRNTLNGLTTLAVNTISAVQPSAVAQQEATTGFVPAPEGIVPTSGNMLQILTSDTDRFTRKTHNEAVSRRGCVLHSERQ